MNHCVRIRVWAVALLSVYLAAAFLSLPLRAGEEYGRAIFTYEFEVGKGVTPGGDGLGPVYNHRSCVGCHSQGGVGGGGPLDVNVQMLAARRAVPADMDVPESAVTPAQPADRIDVPGPPDQMCATSSRQDPRQELKSLHSGFVTSRSQIVPNILLHRFGADERYAEFREALGGAEVPLAPTLAERGEIARRLNASPVAPVKRTDAIHVQCVQRNTPALFGAGLIDQIPDAALHVQATFQSALGIVSGRVPPVERERVGRFGWRGQTEHLSDFVIAACANELGLEVPGQPQPQGPFVTSKNKRSNRLDLTQKHCDALTAYVASLPRPEFIAPAEAAERQRALRGQEIFQSIGCGACHMRSLDGVDGIYSDLLLHDLGPDLADPVAAEFEMTLVNSAPMQPAELKRAQRGLPSPSSNPYGGGQGLTTLAEELNRPVRVVDAKAGTKSEFRRKFSHVDREWRTPPLWGVADSAPYMHDGRAATLAEAISLHGGEAQNIKEQFFTLPAEERLAVIAFLKCLRAPL
jgi:CxxC motif-containing protein (DUF1111 family)